MADYNLVKLDSKTPADDLLYKADFTQELQQAGDSFQGSAAGSWSAVNPNDSSNAVPTFSSEANTLYGCVAKITGGTPGEEYIITVNVTSNGGYVYNRSALLPVVKYKG